MWPQWLYQPWPQLWISPSNLIGPVSRALCYLLGQDLKQNNELVCLPLERFWTRSLSCHYLLMDQATVILCYELFGQEALALHQVKPHVVRPLAASKAFQLLVSLEKIFQPATGSNTTPSHSSV